MRSLTFYIGRFSPFHKGHLETLERALDSSDHVLVIIGSAAQPRTIKNPWTAAEREQMIRDAIRNPRTARKLMICHARDIPYNDELWVKQIQQLVETTANNIREAFDPVTEIRLTGADRDESTYYLKLFPNYKTDLVHENREVTKFMTATSIRDLYFGRMLANRPTMTEELYLVLSALLPANVHQYLRDFEQTESFAKLKREYETVQAYKASWAMVPFPPTFVTVDAVVIEAGHVLLVERGKGALGEGLWALPGGFLDQGERLLDASIRELHEETKLRVPEQVLRGSFKHQAVFDAPNRSLRGRTITHAFLYHLKPTGAGLPKVKGSSDARHAFWLPLNEALSSPENFFEDHHAIIENMIGKL